MPEPNSPGRSGPNPRRARLPVAIVVLATLIAGSPPAAEAARPRLLHVPADLFAPTGPLGALELDACRIVLADGPDGSLLRVSPAMAGLGFSDIAFTVPPLAEEVAFGLLATTLRLRIPGRDPDDPSTTIQSTRLTTRIAGASVELTASFEGLGAEMTGEYFARDPRTGEDGWVHALDVEIDNLTIAVSFPVRALGTTLNLGAPTVRADFSFGVSGRGWAGMALDGTFAKDVVQSAIERSVAGALDFEAYRGPLAAAITAWLHDGAFRDLQLREIRLQPTADGGLDVLAVTTSDP